MLIPNNTKIVMRSGGSFARGTTIDLYLDPKEIKTLYERWNSAAWGEIYSLPGGEIFCITVLFLLLKGCCITCGGIGLEKLVSSIRAVFDDPDISTFACAHYKTVADDKCGLFTVVQKPSWA